ncbi:LysR substrate-binding domain-containing protein [Sulfitobacter sp. SBS6]|uniref:LysR substrate-binding domain-containing protein n=1 Tax=Sulfitobacter sp. SBS6 TaxID=3401755 RepID=UPI003AB0E0D8
MTLDQLRIFVAVAEREHMTRAAEALNQTQSATSAAIAALEERHNLRLFDRIGRRIVLTDAGRDFLGEARAVLARAAIASQRLDDLAGVKRGRLRLAASQTVANYWLPAVIARFREAHPEIALTVRIGNSDDAARAVEALQADIGIIEGDCQLTTLRAKAVAGDTLRLVFPSGAEGGDLSPERLRHTPWILREAGSGTRDSFLQWLGRQGLGLEELESTLELPSNEAVCSAVEAGIGAALLSDLVVRRSIEAGRMVDVPIDTPQRRFHILTHAERQPSALEARFIHHAETSF